MAGEPKIPSLRAKKRPDTVGELQSIIFQYIILDVLEEKLASGGFKPGERAVDRRQKVDQDTPA
jgi:hypothetical protein